MPVLTAAVILLAVLCLGHLLLTAVVIRRLRDQGTRLARLQALGPPLGPTFLPVGSSMPEFTSETVDGEVVSHVTLASGRCAVAFLQSSCQHCRDRVADLRTFAADLPAGWARVVAVVTGDGDGADGIVDGLRAVALVVSGPHAAPIVRAFEVSGFPTFYAFDGGAVRAAGADPRHLAVLIPD